MAGLQQQQQRKQQAEEREMTFDEANKAAETFNASQLEKPYGQRRFASVEPTTRPGFSALKIGLAEMTQAEKDAVELDDTLRRLCQPKPLRIRLTPVP